MDRLLLSASASAIEQSGGVPSALLDALLASRDATEAPHEVEASEILCRFMAARRGASLAQLLAQSGGTSTAVREALVRRLTGEAAAIFSSVSANHVCESSSDQARWQLRKMDRMRYRDGASDKVISSVVAPIGSEPVLEKQATRGCRLHHPFSAGEHFTALSNGKMYLATGEVYLCTASGKVHVCADGYCNRTSRAARDEGLVCELTGNFFKAASVYSEPNRNARERQDGGVTISAAGRAGAAADARGWQPTRTKDQRDAFKARRITFIAAHDRNEAVRRALDPMSRLYYDFSTQEYSHDGSTPVASHLVSSVLERTMRVHYPEADHPQVTPTLREQVTDVFRFLFEGGVPVVRNSQWERTSEACQRGAAAVRAYVNEMVRKRKHPDVFVAESMFVAEVQPQFSRFDVLGVSESSANAGSDIPEVRELRMYIQDCVISVWIMMHYMPFAKRYVKGIPLSKHIVGIIYKLQTGFYVMRNQDEYITLIPRHGCLDALPMKNDLNKHEYFRQRQGYNSQSVMETGELISNCFSSLLDGSRPVEEILRFQLPKYVRIWSEPSVTSSPSV